MHLQLLIRLHKILQLLHELDVLLLVPVNFCTLLLDLVQDLAEGLLIALDGLLELLLLCQA